MAGLGTRVSIECPDGYVGRMDRRCGKNGKAPLGSSGKWEPVNKVNLAILLELLRGRQTFLW